MKTKDHSRSVLGLFLLRVTVEDDGDGNGEEGGGEAEKR